MIKNTFLFIPKIGRKTEENMWKNGILSWDDLTGSIDRMYPDTNRRNVVTQYLSKSQDALDRKDAAFFARHLPSHAHWRIYREFVRNTVFLDIETTGLSPYYDTINLIGTYDGTSAKIFVKDTNLEEIGAYLEQFEIIVTFNGKLFDIPFIRKTFPDIVIPPVHVDLRFLLKSLGFSGPLKKIEKTLVSRGTQKFGKLTAGRRLFSGTGF
jgi:uncharacterized protein